VACHAAPLGVSVRIGGHIVRRSDLRLRIVAIGEAAERIAEPEPSYIAGRARRPSPLTKRLLRHIRRGRRDSLRREAARGHLLRQRHATTGAPDHTGTEHTSGTAVSEGMGARNVTHVTFGTTCVVTCGTHCDTVYGTHECRPVMVSVRGPASPRAGTPDHFVTALVDRHAVDFRHRHRHAIRSWR